MTTIKTQEILPGRVVTIHLANGDVDSMLVAAADLVGIWDGRTLIPWAAIDRIEVAL